MRQSIFQIYDFRFQIDLRYWISDFRFFTVIQSEISHLKSKILSEICDLRSEIELTQ